MIIQRYIFKEIMLSFSATLFVLLLIIIGNTFVRLLSDVSDGSLPVDVLSELVFLKSFNTAIRLTPIALLIGMMLAFGKLYRDHEISALHASGVGPRQFYKGIFLFVGPLTLLISLLVIFVLPQLEIKSQEIRYEVQQRPEAAGIPIGEFTHSKVKGEQLTLFVEDINNESGVMKNVFLHIEGSKNRKSDNRNANHIEKILASKQALLYLNPESGSRVFKFKDGSIYKNNHTTGEFTITKFTEHGLHIPALSILKKRNLETKSITQLIKNNDNESKAEIHLRFAMILSAPIMALLAFPLSHTTPRQGRYGKIAIGILLYAVYANLIFTGQSKIENGEIPNWLGLWWVHIIFISLSLILVHRQYKQIR